MQELIQLTKMAEIGRISGSIAHEINNPLMVAQGFAENIELLLDSKDFSRDELRMQILEIIKACQRMTKVINKMNRMSRKQELRLSVVDMAEVALNAVEFVKSQIEDLSRTLAANEDLEQWPLNSRQGPRPDYGAFLHHQRRRRRGGFGTGRI